MKIEIRYPRKIEKRIYGNPFYEILTRFLFRILKLGRCVFLDIGAHVGEYSIFMALHNPNATIISIEPDKINFELLLENIKNNNVRNVIPIKIAALHRTGKVKLFKSRFSGGHSVIKKFKEFTWVKSKRVDDLVKELGIEKKIKIVKIDVNGAEEKVLYGMKNILKKDKPIMIVERYTFKDALKVKKILQYFGYKVMIRIGLINYVYF